MSVPDSTLFIILRRTAQTTNDEKTVGNTVSVEEHLYPKIIIE